MRLIRLAPDYFCYPLWEASPGQTGDIDPKTLPISLVLQEQLINWAKVFDQILDMDDPGNNTGFASIEAVITFNRTGAALAKQLRSELGPEYTIIEKFLRGEDSVRKTLPPDG